MAIVDIPDSWMPTAENLYTLPKPLRRYIHDLQANVEPVETMRENFRLRQENATLRKKLAGTLAETGPFFADHFSFGPKS
jgi:regulator of replication initiation timing